MTTWQRLASRALAATLAGALAGCAPTYQPRVEVAGQGSAAPELVPAPSAEGGDSTAQEKKQAKHDERHYNRRVAGWVSVAIGSIGLGVALGTSYLMLHEQSVRSSECPNKVCSQAGLQANSELSTLTWPNVGAWVVAGVGLGLGAFLLVTHPAPDPNKGSFAIGVTPNGSGAGIDLRRTF